MPKINYIKSFKIRLYPTKAQEQLLWQHIGASRFIWNYMVAKQEERYRSGERHWSAFDMNYHITDMKREPEYDWLKQISARTLYDTCADLAKAYDRFFSHSGGHPRFKSRKRSPAAAPLCSDRCYFADEKRMQIGKIGRVKYRTDRRFPLGNGNVKLSNVRIKNVEGKWMLSFGISCESQAVDRNTESIGIDVGVKDLMTVAFGDQFLSFPNINKSSKVKQLYQEIKHLQRSISRKYEANKQGNKYVSTNNIEKQQKKLRRAYQKITNIRENYFQQSTAQLIRLCPDHVTMENLNVAGMLQNHKLAKAISQASLSRLIAIMQYKCEWAGIPFILADRWFPSSQVCSDCGVINPEIKNLKIREWDCPCCGSHHDRDKNAAINLMRYQP